MGGSKTHDAWGLEPNPILSSLLTLLVQCSGVRSLLREGFWGPACPTEGVGRE